MSLGTQLVRAVQKEAAMQRPLPLTARAQTPLPKGGTAEAEIILHDNDRFSHMAGELKVKTKGSSGAASPQKNAEAFCERAGYLTERLQFVENDARGNAVVRSTPESMRGPRSEYFEGAVGKDEISLKRYKPNADKPGREAVPFVVTDEVLERLADDAAGVLSGSKK
jgi:hypothetical protein